MGHKTSFDIKTANDFYEKMLLPQYEEFVENNSSSRHALLTTILAYHLYEWVQPKEFTKERFREKYPGNEGIRLLFDDARKITNGLKHFNKEVPVTTTQNGFSSGFSSGFARPLNIVLSDGSEIPADDFLKKLVEFWKDRKVKGDF